MFQRWSKGPLCGPNMFVDWNCIRPELRGRVRASKTSLYLRVVLLLTILRRFLSCSSAITKTYLYNFDPLKPHFYIVKLGFTGVYIIFLISAQKHKLWYLLEPPRRGGSNEYPRSMFWAEIWKISAFLSENCQFLEVKFSIYLNRRVFVMFVCASLFHMWRLWCPYLFVISPSFSASGGLCFVIVAFSWYFYLYVYMSWVT